MRIIETDNYGGDYPNEQFVNLPRGTKEQLEPIADAINKAFCCRRFWRVVEDSYVLQPGFEP